MHDFIISVCFFTPVVLGIVGGFRSFMSPHTTQIETITIIIALVLIVFISVVLGSTLPLMLQAIKVDPAHSSTSIQVIMDILGVIITCAVAMSILYSTRNAAASPANVNIEDIASVSDIGDSDLGNGSSGNK